MENISTRLKKYIDYKNLSIRAFERSLDWGNSTVNNTKDNITSEKMMQLKEIYPELNLQWVLMGVGEMILENYLDDPFSPRYTQLPEPKTDKKADALEQLDRIKSQNGKGSENEGKVVNDDEEVPVTTYIIPIKGFSNLRKHMFSDDYIFRV